VLARQQSPSRGSVRYYLWSGDQLRRIPDRLHYDLLNGVVSLPEFAGTKQKIVEVFLRTLTSSAQTLTTRGIVYPFDDEGRLNLRPLVEDASKDIARPSRIGNVIQFQQRANQKRVRDSYGWTPSKAVVAEIRADILKQLRVPRLKPQKKD
jgi:hypothetical protein